MRKLVRDISESFGERNQLSREMALSLVPICDGGEPLSDSTPGRRSKSCSVMRRAEKHNRAGRADDIAVQVSPSVGSYESLEARCQ